MPKSTRSNKSSPPPAPKPGSAGAALVLLVALLFFGAEARIIGLTTTSVSLGQIDGFSQPGDASVISVESLLDYYDFFHDHPAPLPPLPPAVVPAPAPVVVPTVRTIHLPILMYHHIGTAPAGADPIRLGLTVSRPDFHAQLAWLHAQGYHAVTLTQVYGALVHGDPLPSKPISLTFDDGYLDNYTDALPELTGFGDRATFFIIGNLKGGPDYMTWEQIADAHVQGIEIEAHSMNHLDLALTRGAALDYELTGPRILIQSYIGEPANFLAYPSGRYDATTIARASAAGYLMAVTTNPGAWLSADTLMELPRARVRGGETLPEFINELAKS